MKKRIPELNVFIDESKVAEYLMDLINKAKENPENVRFFIDLTDFLGLNPKNPQNIFKVKNVVTQFSKEEDIMTKLMQLKENANKMKLMTKDTWDSLNHEEREDALLQAIKDPDDIVKYIKMKYNELPDEVTAAMYENN